MPRNTNENAISLEPSLLEMSSMWNSSLAKTRLYNSLVSKQCFFAKLFLKSAYHAHDIYVKNIHDTSFLDITYGQKTCVVSLIKFVWSLVGLCERLRASWNIFSPILHRQILVEIAKQSYRHDIHISFVIDNQNPQKLEGSYDLASLIINSLI